MLIVICRGAVYNKNRRIQSFPAVFMLVRKKAGR